LRLPWDVWAERNSAIPALCRTAIVAPSVVNADRPSALETLILRPLARQESLQAVALDLVQVLDHAHVVFGSVSFIQMSQILAGKTVTSKTELCFTFLNNFTVFDFTSNNGNGFVGICCPATGAFISFPQISHANPAVHSAWRNEFLIHAVFQPAAA
jgi:hypothetical protein